MIKKLRIRFIVIAMAAIVIVLAVILSGIYVVSRKNIANYSDKVLMILAKNDGAFPKDYRGDKAPGYLGLQSTDETPFDTRYFTVTYDAAGKPRKFNLVKTELVSTPEEALEYCNEAFSEKEDSGAIGDYRYLIYRDRADGGTMVLFMDCHRQIDALTSFMRSSMIFCLSAVGAICVLLILFSKRAVEPIANSYEKQRHFISDASHELKTPLAIISANNEILEMDYGENECTDAIQKQVVRMANMTKNLTTLTKIDERAALEERRNIDVGALISDVAEPYYALARTADLNIEVNIPGKYILYGDEGLLRQMVSLLLDNAVKYGKSYVRISARKTVTKLKRIIVLEFRNDAENVEQGNLDKYFARFFRSDGARASGIEGSGIGLSIVKEIAELHKGEVSARGVGNDFVVTITFDKFSFGHVKKESENE